MEVTLLSSARQLFFECWGFLGRSSHGFLSRRSWQVLRSDEMIGSVRAFLMELSKDNTDLNIEEHRTSNGVF